MARAKKAVPREKERRIGPPERSEFEAVSIVDGDGGGGGGGEKRALESRYSAAKVHGVLLGFDDAGEVNPKSRYVCMKWILND